MNTDIRLSIGFWEHPKTVKLERRLGLSAVRSLQILWMWAAQNRPNGSLSGMDTDDIEIAAKWYGEPTALFDALTSLGWIDKNDETYALHDWADHNPWQAESESRAGKARLSRLARDFPDAAKYLSDNGRAAITEDEYQAIRSNNGRTTVVQKIANDRSTPFQCLSNTSPKPKIKKNPPKPPCGGDGGNREEKNKTGNTLPELQEAVAAYTPNPELRKAFEDFRVMRERIRKPMTGRALRNIFAELDRLSPSDDAGKIAILDQSITQSWQGIFPLKDNGNARASPGYASPAQRRLDANKEAGRKAKQLLFGKEGENAATGL